MQKRIDVLCAGLALVNFPIFPVEPELFDRDVNPVGPIELMPGGDAANQAIVLSRLGNRVALISKRGNDVFGKCLVDLLASYGRGVDVSGISVSDEEATSVCAMMIRKNGQRHFCSHRGALNTLSKEDIDERLVESAKVVSIGGLMTLPRFDGEGTEHLFRLAKEAGAITVADTKKDLWGIGLKGIERTLRYTDYFFPSLAEALDVSGKQSAEQAARVFLDAGTKNVGIKLGEEGCYFTDGRRAFYQPAMKTKVVDTTGAGDNFMSGFITGLVRHRDAEACCRLGTKCGAICVGKVGPCGAVESLEQVESFEGGQ